MSRPVPSTRRFGVGLVRAASVLAVLGAASSASAHPDMPQAIMDHFPGLSCAPECTLCHVNPTPPPKTLKGENVIDYAPAPRGFGVFVENLIVMKGGNITTSAGLITKLDAMKTAPCNPGDANTKPCDSDGDNVSDYLEVSTGKDPDQVGDGSGAICPTYGCGASIGTLPHRSSDTGRAGAVMAALGVALVLARRFRR